MNQETKQEERVPRMVVTGPPGQGLSFSIPAWLRLQATTTGTTGVLTDLPPQPSPDANPAEKTPMVVDTASILQGMRIHQPSYPEPKISQILRQEWPSGFDLSRMDKEHEEWELEILDYEPSFPNSARGNKLQCINFIYEGCLFYVDELGLVEIQGPKYEELLDACHALNPVLVKYNTIPLVVRRSGIREFAEPRP